VTDLDPDARCLRTNGATYVVGGADIGGHLDGPAVTSFHEAADVVHRTGIA
jgi:hypothetical protein